jgi:calcineurin-like phosphoesterase family protein
MSEIWITGDPHFGHDKNKKGLGGIIHHAKRTNPITFKEFENIEAHDSFILDQFNKTCSPKDTLIIAGDFAWKNHNHYIGGIRCKKILIRGSHDKMNQDCLKNFTAVHEGMWITTIHNVQFVITHCAMLVWEASHYGSINCYAHSHQRLEERDDVKRMDVGVDGSPNYAPWNIDFIIYKMSLKLKPKYNKTEEELNAIINKNKENNAYLLRQWSQLKTLKN